MSSHVTRRMILAGAAGLAAGRAVADSARESPLEPRPAPALPKAAADGPDPSGQIGALERRAGGRLGVFAVDTSTGRRIEHFRHERFPMCSTFKFLAAAAVLQRVDKGAEHLERRVAYSESDLLEYAPVAKEQVKQGGMTLGDICAAAVQWSDNTAANLILKSLGGPQAVTAFIRTLGDEVTRLDDNEPAMNVVPPGQTNNTTTPASMVWLLSSVLLGHVLSSESRARLEGWMLDAKVGQGRLAAGLPSGWQIAHKTGTASTQTNDVAVLWPPNRGPILAVVFYTRGGLPQERRDDVLRDVGRIVAASF